MVQEVWDSLLGGIGKRERAIHPDQNHRALSVHTEVIKRLGDTGLHSDAALSLFLYKLHVVCTGDKNLVRMSPRFRVTPPLYSCFAKRHARVLGHWVL